MSGPESPGGAGPAGGTDLPGGWLPPTDAGATYVPPPAAPPPPDAPARVPAGAGAGPGAAERATYGARAGAAAIDLLVRLVITAPFVLLLNGALDGTVPLGDGIDGEPVRLDSGVALGLFLGQLAGCVYSVAMLARFGGQTLGHRATGTRVVTLDGRPVGAGKAAAREVGAKYLLFEALGGVVLLIPTLLNYLWPLWDPQDQALHDKLCGTGVVRA